MFGNGENEDPKKNKAWSNANWLKSRFHFSFAEYHDARNGQFGVLRVLNDDLVQPNRGFGTHGHGDMEIVTYIVRGALTHQDSMGSAETLGRGAAQFMSAGTGVRHSEFNRAKDADLRFIQMWITPRRRGLKPAYGGFQSTPEQRKDTFLHLVSDVANETATTPVKIAQDANIFVAEISAGNKVELPIASGRQGYVVILEGTDVTVAATGASAGSPYSRVPSSGSDAAPALNDGEDVNPSLSIAAHAHDAFEVYGGGSPAGTVLSFKAGATPAHVLVVEMKQDGRPGRTDF